MPDQYKAPTADEIKAVRAAFSLTQAQAAALCRASLSSYKAWEQGRRRMHPAIWMWFGHIADKTAVLQSANGADRITASVPEH